MTSIWLQLAGREEQGRHNLIERPAGEHHTVSFCPHLTVCSAPDDPAVFDNAAAYVRECGLWPPKVTKTAVTGAVITPVGAVFIEIEHSPALREFRERLLEVLDAPALIPPHFSLLYTLDRASQRHRSDLNAQILAAIAGRCAEAIRDTEFTVLAGCE